MQQYCISANKQKTKHPINYKETINNTSCNLSTTEKQVTKHPLSQKQTIISALILQFLRLLIALPLPPKETESSVWVYGILRGSMLLSLKYTTKDLKKKKRLNVKLKRRK